MALQESLQLSDVAQGEEAVPGVPGSWHTRTLRDSQDIEVSLSHRDLPGDWIVSLKRAWGQAAASSALLFSYFLLRESLLSNILG